MRTAKLIACFAIAALASAPAIAHHEDNQGFSECSYSHDEPHYGLYRESDDPATWVSEGDPDNPWVGSTSPTGAVYAGRFGGSDGKASYSAGACGVGLAEVAVYEENDGSVNVVIVGDNGNQNAAGNGYTGINTGHGGKDHNKGGKLCVQGTCTEQDTPIMCEQAGPGRVDWHKTDEDGCNL